MNQLVVGDLKIGDSAEIVKLRPDGTEGARYSGTLMAAPPGWVVAHATWTFRHMDLGYMVFDPGDYLLEYFATDHPYNAFALFGDDQEFKGWYCNVTHPTSISDQTIYWHDLYVDVIQRADGKILVLDEDELAESSLEHSDPTLHRMILDARDELLQRLMTNQYPFDQVSGAPQPWR